jgi:hypothetical protein
VSFHGCAIHRGFGDTNSAIEIKLTDLSTNYCAASATEPMAQPDRSAEPVGGSPELPRPAATNEDEALEGEELSFDAELAELKRWLGIARQARERANRLLAQCRPDRQAPE